METEEIQWEPTTLYNLHQNRVAEQCFSTLFIRTQAMLYDEGLPNNQWCKAISTAVYLKNRSSTKSLKRITPYESDTSSKPDLSNLHRLGCVIYHHNKDPKCTKFSNQGIKYVFLGYEGRNQYRFWDPTAQKVVQSSHVNWDKLKAPSFIPPLGEVELKWYDTNSEASL